MVFQLLQGYRPVGWWAQLKWTVKDMEGPIMEKHVREICKAVERNAPPIKPAELNKPTPPIIVFRNLLAGEKILLTVDTHGAHE